MPRNIILFGFLCLCGCANRNDLIAVARIGKTPVLASELKNYYVQLAASQKTPLSNPEDRRKLLSSLILRKSFAIKGAALCRETHELCPASGETRDEGEWARVFQVYLYEKRLIVSESDVEAYYRANRRNFNDYMRKHPDQSLQALRREIRAGLRAPLFAQWYKAFQERNPIFIDEAVLGAINFQASNSL